MEPETVIARKKSKTWSNVNLPVAECIRQFELPQQFPSTITELRKNGLPRGTPIMQAKGVPNIISALPLSKKMKFVPNKEVPPSENLQKLKLKSISGKDLGELKLISSKPEEKLQHKVITMSEITKKLNKSITWPVSSLEKIQEKKPKIKNISEILTKSSIGEQFKKSEKAVLLKSPVKLLNGKSKLSVNTTQNSSKQILIQSAGSDVLKKILIPNIRFDTQQNQSQFVTVKQFPESQKVMLIQKDNKQTVTTVPEKIVQFKTLKKDLLSNQAITKINEKVTIQAQPSEPSTKKRNSSSLDQSKDSEIKRLCRDKETQILKASEDFNVETLNNELGDCSEMKNYLKKRIGVAARKNIMVIVPNEATEELTLASNCSNTNNEESILDESNGILFLHDEDIVDPDNFNQDSQILSKINTTKNIHEEETESNINLSNINQNTKNSNSENLSDKFSILEKAVLSVQDANLRAKALKALKDCGIKIKKRVPIKRSVPTKIINESAVQTNVFSLLKEGEFLEADEANENLMQIKFNHKLTKQPIRNLGTNFKSKVCIQDQTEYKHNLDSMIDKMFQNNKNVSDVKDAFVVSKKIQAKHMLKQLQKDFETAKIYDEDGYFGIHRAVVDGSLQQVQKHIIILKATKQSIDICTQNDQTSLELAVELEVDSKIIKILLDSGAQPVSSKMVHNSALILAAKKSSKVLSLLFDYINDSQRSLLNAKNSEGFAAIHYCAQNGNLKGITELIKHGADVNLQEERSGRTALFYAVDTKNSDVPQEVYNEIAQKLVDNGAFSNIQTFSKHSVLSLIDDVKSHSLKISLNRAVQ